MSNKEGVDLSWALDLAPSNNPIDDNREFSCVDNYTLAEEEMMHYAGDVFLSIMSKIGAFTLVVAHVSTPYDLRLSDGFVVTAIDFQNIGLVHIDDPYSFPEEIKAFDSEDSSDDVLRVAEILKSKCSTQKELENLLNLFSKTFDLLNFAPTKFVRFG